MLRLHNLQVGIAAMQKRHGIQPEIHTLEIAQRIEIKRQTKNAMWGSHGAYAIWANYGDLGMPNRADQPRL